MKKTLIWIGALVVLVAVAASFTRAGTVLPERRSSVPTAKVVKGPLKLTVFATGELRAGRTTSLMAPPAGGSLRIVKLSQTGTAVKKDDVVIEFDPADQQFALEQAKSDLDEAEQQIVKMKADNAVQASQDALDTLTARYNVRRGELDTAGNEFIGAIEAQKNTLTLEENRRRLEQLQQDSTQRAVTSAAPWCGWRWSARRASSTTSSSSLPSTASSRSRRTATGSSSSSPAWCCRSTAKATPPSPAAISPTSSRTAGWKCAPR